ncbi:MAG: hypothetical protein JJU32_19950 [Phormidium sp. BM_Day4_Bin.17]|nr:hypothetical protein [Phormidium sp. BM_Day4_Bin.17]UCJ12395.1 MAG: hypothetical protein JWS08_00750 [Phormidium sp. PBR-2020]
MNCPCCSGKLLRQVSRRELTWFCPSCRSVFPSSTTSWETVKPMEMLVASRR